MNGIESNKIIGISSAKAKKQLLKYGENVLKENHKMNPLAVFAGQFKDSMVIILLISTAISFFLGDIVEAYAIVSIVFINAVIGFSQEYKTEKTLEKLKEISAPTAVVLRDGIELEVPTREIVPEDLIKIKTGDRIPADAIVLESHAMMCDESMLTGESLAVEKQALEQEIPQEQNKIYKGTTVTRGYGWALVSQTGMNTKMGEIASLLINLPEKQTPLQKKLDKLGKNIAVICVAICLFVIVNGMFKGMPLLEMLIAGISLAVAAVPEGLPAVVTICLMISVKKMLNHQALIKKLSAVEVMGCVNVICTDKTGTLTQNKMTVREIHTLEHSILVTGEEKGIRGEFKIDNNNVNVKQSLSLKKLMDCAVHCNNAQIRKDSHQEEWTTQGEPTETALLVMAARSNYNPEIQEIKRLDERPFDSTSKKMSVLVEDSSGIKTLYVKGATEILLQKCKYYLTDRGIMPLTQATTKKILDQLTAMGSSAYRTMGFAYEDKVQTMEERDMIFIGMVGMIDPPRKEAYDSIKQCKTAGIHTVMITGDHKETATAIARELKLLEKNSMVVTGDELNKMTDEELCKILDKISVFARVTPEHKLRIVGLYKQKGNVVAMTGDGVNDAPAIKEADIGVAMASGAEVTKEAASVVLLDNNFSTLVRATEEGRTIYGNIRRFIQYILTCNIGEVISVLLGTFLGITAIFRPIQLLLINLVTDSLPAISLAFEPKENNVMKRPPRKENGSIFDHGLTTIILFRGCMIGIATLYTYVFFFKHFGETLLAQTAALMTLILSQLIYAFECKSKQKNVGILNILTNPRLLLAVAISLAITVLTTTIPYLKNIFATVSLTYPQWGCIAAVSFAPPILWAVIEKLLPDDSQTEKQ